MQLSALQWLEVAAVVLAVIYLLLAIRQNIWCWAAAAISTSLYLYIMYAAQLYMESALQVFYLGMAAYGWYEWRYGGKGHTDLKVSTWLWRYHLDPLSRGGGSDDDRCPDMGAPVRNRTRAARPDIRNLTGEVPLGNRHNGRSVRNT